MKRNRATVLNLQRDSFRHTARHFRTHSASANIGAPSEYLQSNYRITSDAREDAARPDPSHSATFPEAGNRTKDTSQETRRRLAAIMRGVMPIPTETPELPPEPVRIDWNIGDETDNDETETEHEREGV
jgi:hypothetical protein